MSVFFRPIYQLIGTSACGVILWNSRIVHQINIKIRHKLIHAYSRLDKTRPYKHGKILPEVFHLFNI